jgi:methyl-accepting chemotaxis protein
MLENMCRQTREINEGVNSLAAASSEISTMTAQLAASTAETATAITQSTATAEEVKQTSQLSSQKARTVADISQKAMQAAEVGARSVDETSAMMKHIREQMESVAQSIMRLSEQGQAIGEIVATVSDLADQSNLLAVNASIEAARAGEQGKGFAVVAHEIQSLAEQSKRATTQVRTILSDIQKATSGAVMAIEQGNKAAESGVQQSAKAGDAIRLLAGGTKETAQAVTQIAAVSQQQMTGMDQLALAMENIKKASAEAADSTRQAETAARNLHELGMRLKQMVGQYKV